MMAGFPLGRLPGDMTIRRGAFTFYFPLASSLLVSVLLTAVMYLLRRYASTRAPGSTRST